MLLKFQGWSWLFDTSQLSYAVFYFSHLVGVSCRGPAVYEFHEVPEEGCLQRLIDAGRCRWEVAVKVNLTEGWKNMHLKNLRCRRGQNERREKVNLKFTPTFHHPYTFRKALFWSLLLLARNLPSSIIHGKKWGRNSLSLPLVILPKSATLTSPDRPCTYVRQFYSLISKSELMFAHRVLRNLIFARIFHMKKTVLLS